MDLFSTNEITHLLATYGYIAVFLFIAIESSGIPFPGESMLMAASIYAAATHNLHIVLVIAAAAAGAVIGDNLGYLAGRIGGYQLLHRYGRYVHLDERRLRLGRYLFKQHGGKVVFFGRFVAVLRTWAAFLAGANEMPWTRFMAFNAAGAVGWAALMGLLAYTVGNAAVSLGGWIGVGLGVVASLLTIAALVAIHRNETRLQAEADRVLLPAKQVAA